MTAASSSGAGQPTCSTIPSLKRRGRSLPPRPTFTGPFNLTSGPLAPAGSADFVLTARNIHNWMWQPGMLDKAMADFHAVLKPGGTLAVEEHRADPRAEQVVGGRVASDGYVATKTVIANGLDLLGVSAPERM